MLRSINYYPVGPEQADEGIANLALGLGKYIVDGGVTLRFSPHHPTQVVQTSTPETALRDTQTSFYALNMQDKGLDFKVDDGFNLLRLPVAEALNDGQLQFIASTYDFRDQIMRHGIYDGGRKVITFNGLLAQDIFPLPELLQAALRWGKEAMKRPVEIEFAGNMNADRTGELYLLQIRPIVDAKQMLDIDIDNVDEQKCLVRSAQSLGHGICQDVCDVVYVKTADFNAADNTLIADEIKRLNEQLTAENRPYVLIGPGRWGSGDAWLGIPVKWAHISGARIIVEQLLDGYAPDPSQGTHFFQNLTSFGVGYLTIDPNQPTALLRMDVLDRMETVSETSHLRHVRFCEPLTIMMDGMQQKCVVLTV